MYSACTAYGDIAQLQLKKDSDGSTYDLIFTQTQTDFRSVASIRIGADEIPTNWLRSDTNGGNLFSYDSPEIIPNDSLIPRALRPCAPTPIAETLCQPLDQESPKHILNALNDDCLEYIFKHNSLTLNDAEALVSVCRRFEWIQKSRMRAPRHRFANEYLHMARLQPLWCIEKFLSEYGVSVTYADLNSKFNSPDVVLGMLAKYCPNIQYLECNISKQCELIEMQSMFGKLRRLFTKLTSTIDFNEMSIRNNESVLEVWHISTLKCTVVLPSFNLPQLTLFNWVEDMQEIQPRFHLDELNASIKPFVSSNSQLQQLILSAAVHVLFPELGYLLQTCCNLQLLKFRNLNLSVYYWMHYLYLIREQNRFSLDMGNGYLSFRLENVISTLGILRRLQIPLDSFSILLRGRETNNLYMECAAAICRQYTITRLCVQYFNDDEIMLFAQHLNSLEHFSIEWFGSSLNRIPEFLETAGNLKSATFRCSYPVNFDGTDIADLAAIDYIVRQRNIEFRLSMPREILRRYRRNVSRF